MQLAKFKKSATVSECAAVRRESARVCVSNRERERQREREVFRHDFEIRFCGGFLQSRKFEIFLVLLPFLHHSIFGKLRCCNFHFFLQVRDTFFIQGGFRRKSHQCKKQEYVLRDTT